MREGQLLSLLLDAVHQAIIASDRSGRILYWNRFAEGLYGWRAEEVIGKNIAEVLTPHDVERGRAAVARASPKPTPTREWSLRRKDGSTIVVSSAATPILDVDGAMIGIVGVSWDVSDKKQLEEELHRSETRLKMFAEQLPALAWATDKSLTVVWTLGGAFRPFERWAGAAYAHRCALAGASASFEIEEDGVVRHAVVQPFRDPAGEIQGTIGVAFDITLRKRAENALRESERRLADAETIGRVGSWEINVAARSLILSDALLRILGRTRDEVVPTWDWYFTCVHPDDRDQLRMRNTMLVERGEVIANTEYRIVRPDGEVRIVHSQGEAKCDASGRPVRVVGALRDVTEQRNAEREIALRVERQAAVARLGLEALRQTELQPLLDRAVAITRKTLGVDFCGVFESLPDGTLALRACDGFPEPIPELLIPNDDRSQAALTRSTRETVVTEDIEQETRFELHPTLRARGVKSGVTAPIMGHDRVHGVVGAHSTTPRTYGEDVRHFLQAVANTLGSAMERHRVEEEIRAQREQLQALSRRLIETQEAERRSLARELHDDFGQYLTAVRLHLQAARTAKPADTARSLDDALHLIDQGIAQVRSMALDLRPSILDDLGLMAALRWLVKRQASRGSFQVALEGDVGLRLRAEVETCAFRLVQEALTNISRHAGARHVSIEVNASPRELRVVVRDDGKGFDVARVRERSASGAGLGLVSMQERATLVGGRLEIDSRIGAGTTIRAHVPLGEGP